MGSIIRRQPKINEKVKIMIVEDNEDTAHSEADVLTALGFDTVIISDGGKAYEQMKVLRPDIVILDLDLPGKTGDMIAEQMLTDNVLKNVPIIPCSVHLKESADPENLGNKFIRVFHKYTNSAPEAGVSKGATGSTSSTSLKDIIVEVTVACGEMFGAIPMALYEHWKKTAPYKMPPYSIL